MFPFHLTSCGYISLTHTVTHILIIPGIASAIPNTASNASILLCWCHRHGWSRDILNPIMKRN